MATIITRTRAMIGDPLIAGTPPTSVFADQDYQDVLDDRRTDVIQAQLSFRPILQGGTTAVKYVDFWTPVGNWEDSVTLVDALTASITPDTSDLIRGHWTFTAGHLPPVFISGSFYDMYGAAVALLERWQGLTALDFDFTTDGQVFNRSQKREGLAALAASYARRVVPPGKRPAWRALEW